MPGLTAYFGLLDIGRPKAGETVVVSSAAGAVGSIVGQIAKIHDCRAVGIAGGDDKVRYLTDELAVRRSIQLQNVDQLCRETQRTVPPRNRRLFRQRRRNDHRCRHPAAQRGARLSICGQISQYNLEQAEMGPRWLWTLIVKQVRAEGFLVFQFADRFQQAIEAMAGWIQQGKLKYNEDIVEGFENLPAPSSACSRGTISANGW